MNLRYSESESQRVLIPAFAWDWMNDSCIAMQMLWGKKICDLGFYMFMLKLKYLASVKGKTVCLIGRFEPSSKTCSVCGYLYKNLELKEREWRCPECETLHNRDRNASYNILRVGASTLGLGDVSPTAMLAISA